MPELKPGWRMVRFGDVVRQVKDRVNPETSGLERFVAGEHMDTDDLRIRRWGTIGDGYLGPAFHMHFRHGQVLYGSRRTYLRKVALANFEGVCANTTFVLASADPNLLLPELLPFIMQTERFNEHSVRESKGSVNPYVNFSDLAWYEFALPPVEEQEKVAKSLTAARFYAERSSDLADSAADMLSALRESLTENPSFGQVQIGQVARMQNGRPFPSAEYATEGVRLLRPANLHASGTLDWRRERTVHMPLRYATEAADYVVSPGDLVINLTAQSLEDGFMGRVCIAREGDRCLLNQRIGRISTVDGTELHPGYLYRVMQATRFQTHAITMCEGTKVKHLFWHHLERFRFPLPPLEYQLKACAQLDSAESARLAGTSRAHEARQMFHALLNSIL